MADRAPISFRTTDFSIQAIRTISHGKIPQSGGSEKSLKIVLRQAQSSNICTPVPWVPKMGRNPVLGQLIHNHVANRSSKTPSGELTLAALASCRLLLWQVCSGRRQNLNPEPEINLNHANLKPQNLWAVVSQEFAAAEWSLKFHVSMSIVSAG